VDDPQFAGSASFAGYIQVNNHEIDIEIPANCMNTPNVCKEGSCAGDYSTANLNNYIMSNNGGVGQAFTNMCVKVSQANGTPMMLMGDGNYHNYTIEWHTGTSSAGGSPTDAYVNTYIDGVYLGTNNAFVPTRAGRLWMALLPAGSGWNGYPDNWGGGVPGDGKSYTETVLVDFVSITPFNEPNDLAYPSSIDQPDGCDVYYTQCEAAWLCCLTIACFTNAVWNARQTIAISGKKSPFQCRERRGVCLCGSCFTIG
jgi:hypothetical protein